MKYPKIQSIFKRDPATNYRTFLMGEYSLPEFEYLADSEWWFTEKIDGTNIRIMWDGEKVRFGGRTDNAQIPAFLYDKLTELFPVEKCEEVFTGPITLFGEGYGARIQKGGGNYIPDGVSFILFDAWAEMWLNLGDVWNLAYDLGINVAPVVGPNLGTLDKAIEYVKMKPESYIANSPDTVMEGLVLRPKIDLLNRKGQRIITKIKCEDFDEV